MSSNGSESNVWRSVSSTKCYWLKAKHLWTIHDYENVVAMTNEDEETSSDEFSVWRDTAKGREELVFRIDINLNGNKPNGGNDSDIGIYLKLLRIEGKSGQGCKVPINCTFSLLDNNGGNFFDKRFFGWKSTEGGQGWGFHTFCSKNFVMDNKDNVIADGSVRLGIDFEVMCKYPQGSLGVILGMEKVVTESSLNQRVKCLKEAAEMCDFKLVCKGVEINCHKLVLAAGSNVFRAMFAHADTKERQSNRVHIEDSTPDCVQKMVDFLYTDECAQINEHASGLLFLADKYDLPRLRQMSEVWLANNLKVGNVIDTLRFAELHNSAQLTTVCLHFVASHFSFIKDTDVWKNFKEDHPDIMDRLLESRLAPDIAQTKEASEVHLSKSQADRCCILQ